MEKTKDKKENKKKFKKPEWLKKIIEIWKVKQYRSAIKLALYFIFVAGVLIFLQLSSRSTPYQVVLSPLEQYEQANNYEYTYTITENSVSSVIYGTRYKEKEIFQIAGNETKYLLEQNQVYALLPTGKQSANLQTSFKIDKLSPDVIGKILKEAKEISTTTYTTGEKETMYELPVHTFAEIYNGLPVSSEEVIKVKVMIKDSQVTTVLLDLTAYRKLYMATCNQYLLKLEYRNYGQVDEF